MPKNVRFGDTSYTAFNKSKPSYLGNSLSAMLWHYRVYSVTPKPDRLIFVNTERIYIKYPFLMVRFVKVAHPPRYSEM